MGFKALAFRLDQADRGNIQSAGIYGYKKNISILYIYIYSQGFHKSGVFFGVFGHSDYSMLGCLSWRPPTYGDHGN